MEFAVGGGDATWPRTSRSSKRSSRSAARTGARPAGARPRSRPTPTSEVVIIGAGMSGLLAAHRLQQAGVPFVIFEKNDDVGGTWLENTYPGCRVDNPNHNYSYSFAQRHDWPLHFSTQDVLLDYFRALRRRVRPARPHPVRAPRCASATWSEADTRWTVAVQHADGREETLDANAVISAVGQLNRPLFPDIDGPRLVRGPDVPLRPLGPRRRPPRQARRGDRHRRERGAVHPRDRAARRRARSCSSARRRGSARPTTTTTRSSPACAGCTRTCRRTASGTASSSSGRWATACSRACASTPTGNRRMPSVGLFNDILRQLLTGYLGQQFADRPDLLEKVVPDVPARREAPAARQRRVGRRAEARQRAARHRRDPRDHTDRRRHRRRRRARRRRDHLRHRLPGVEVPHADAGHRPRRRRPARALGAATRAPTSASRCPASRTCSASTGRTRTS